MWRVYEHSGKDKDYEVYKEALNAATNEVRKSKRNFEYKLAQNIKLDSKSFYAYVRSKQNVRDKFGPLVDNAGNIITQGFLMAEELHIHFSSVFTREDTSSLPVLCECSIIHWSDFMTNGFYLDIRRYTNKLIIILIIILLLIYQDSCEVMIQYYYSTLDIAMRCFKPAHFNGG